MPSVTFDFVHEGQDSFKSSYSTSGGNDKASILAKIAYAALLLAQPVHAEYVRATPWFLRLSSASSSYQETKVSQETGSLASSPTVIHGNKNFTFIQNADFVHSQQIAELRDEILSFEHLSQGWDGEDAEQISRAAIESAISFIEIEPHQIKFDAFADPDGSVGLQGNIEGGRILLSFAKDGKAAYLIRKDNAVHRGNGAIQDTINKLLAVIL